MNNCHVAIKLYEVGEIFEINREAAALGRLRHPAIPRVLDWAKEGDRKFGRLWLVMDLVDGVSLSDEKFLARLRRRHTATILASLLEIVGYLEGEGIYHGDLHGGNLIIDTQGQLHLVDFGRWKSVQNPPDMEALQLQLRRLLHLARGFLSGKRGRRSRRTPRRRRPGLSSFCALVERHVNQARRENGLVELAPDWLQCLKDHSFLARRCDPAELATLVERRRRKLIRQAQRESE